MLLGSQVYSYLLFIILESFSTLYLKESTLAFTCLQQFNVSGCRKLFFSTRHVLKHGSSYRLEGKNHTQMIRKGNKNYFELEGGSTYQGLKLPKVKLQ